ESRRAVFLSYASEDALAAQRICAALRAVGIEVWFDQSELRGGDAWDATIRRQIKSCALFIPIISSHSHARAEGYFRLEWKLAVDRSHLIATDQPFLVPVVIDGTKDNDLRVPDRFRELQWTPLPDGNTPPAFVERIARLLSGAESSAAADADPYAAAVSLVRERRAQSLRDTAPDAAASHRARLSLLLVAAVATIGLGYVTLKRFVLTSHNTEVPRATPAPQPAAPSPQKSIAVLPFLDMSERKDQGYFSDGLTEELLDRLAQVPDLRVPARTSSFYFKGKQVTIAEVARSLGVANVLEGSVRKAGKTMRVTAQLIRADNGYHLWSNTYDRDVKDVFKVQDEIAAAVVEALKVKLLPTPPSLSAHHSSNSEAYDQYLLGRQLLTRNSADDSKRAAQVFRKAIALDSAYAAAWAGLADAMFWVADSEPAWTATLPDRTEARAAADKSVALQPDLAYGYLIRALLRVANELDFAGAREDLQRALALEPESAEVLLYYGGTVLTPTGKLPEAIVALRKATKADPLNARAWAFLGGTLIFHGDLRAAHAALERSLEISPQQTYAPSWLAQCYLLEGHPAEALKISQRSVAESFRLFGVAIAQYDLGQHAQAEQALNTLITKYGTTAAYQIAEIYAWRGDKLRATFWLERAHVQK
ncbi:MAG TPA: TIR domain-containing protein, partial [Steroidobacteraceae bacterium]|nr:TIR domain-containing protein [Steroidobacteraceae bacterium]